MRLVAEDLLDEVIDDVRAGGIVYRLPGRSNEHYYLIVHRSPHNSYYERNLPGSGLLVWEVNARAGNNREEFKLVDLVCADGL